MTSLAGRGRKAASLRSLATRATWAALVAVAAMAAVAAWPAAAAPVAPAAPDPAGAPAAEDGDGERAGARIGARPLGLAQAVRRALATSHALEGARAQEQLALSRIATAEKAGLPSVSLGVSPVRLGLLDPRVSALVSNLAPGLSPNLLSQNITLNQVLYEGGKIGLGRQSALLGNDVTMLRSDQTARDVAFETATAFLNAVRASELEGAALWGERETERHLADSRLRLAEGAGSRFEVLQAEAALAASRTRLLQAQDAVLVARLALGSLLHQDLGDIPLDPIPLLPEVRADDDARRRGIAARTETRLAQGQVALSRVSAEIARRGRLPTASLQGTLAGGAAAYLLLGTLNWTIFDGGRVEEEIRQRDLAIKADEATLATLCDGLDLEIARARIMREQARKRIALAETGLRTANASVDLANLRFREGAGTGTEVIASAAAASQGRSAYIQATYDELAAQLELARATGLDLRTLLTGPAATPRSKE